MAMSESHRNDMSFGQMTKCPRLDHQQTSPTCLSPSANDNMNSRRCRGTQTLFSSFVPAPSLFQKEPTDIYFREPFTKDESCFILDLDHHMMAKSQLCLKQNGMSCNDLETNNTPLNLTVSSAKAPPIRPQANRSSSQMHWSRSESSVGQKFNEQGELSNHEGYCTDQLWRPNEQDTYRTVKPLDNIRVNHHQADQTWNEIRPAVKIEPTNHRKYSSSVECEKGVEEHFQRSLGKDYPRRIGKNASSTSISVTHPAAVNKQVTHPAAVNKQVTHPAAVNKQVTRPATISKQATHPAAVHKPVTHPAAVKPVTYPAAVKPVTHPAAVNKPVAHPAAVNKPVATLAPVNKQATPPAAISKPVVSLATVNKPLVTLASVNMPMAPSISAAVNMPGAPMTSPKPLAPVPGHKSVPPVAGHKSVAPENGHKSLVPVTGHKSVAILAAPAMTLSATSGKPATSTIASAVSDVEPSVEVTGAVDDHFAKSLGQAWTKIKSQNEPVDLDGQNGSVDDHFAKALGEAWFKIKAEKNNS